MAKSKEIAMDFSKVQDGGGSFDKKHQPEGDYKGKILKVEDAPSKKDDIMQWLYTIEVNGHKYPYYCKHQENQLWKIRNIFIAAGIQVPKAKVKVDPNKVVGKTIGVTLQDTEYKDRLQSEVAAVLPLSEISPDTESDDDDDEDDDDEEDAPPPKKAAKKAAPVVEDDDDEDDEDDDEEPEPPAKKATKRAQPIVEDDDDDDDDDDEEEPPPPPAKKKKRVVVEEDDDLEELDIDGV